jgi:hypothetical protein
MKYKRLLAFGMIGIGSLDLLFGNTNTTVLPTAVTNVLTQQIDLILIGLGFFLLWYS